MSRRAFVTDCEGPVSKNDNAFELTEHFVPEGARLFRILSRYDDVLAFLEKRPEYSAGYTLKLVSPFLKAYEVTNEDVEEYSREHILLIEDSAEALHYISNILPVFIVSTSYEQYVQALCKVVDFPAANTFSTHLDLDRHRLAETDVSKVRVLRDQIVQMREIEIPRDAKEIQDLAPEVRMTVERLDELFFSELKDTSAGNLLEDVRPIGSREKSETLVRIGKRLRASLDGFMYVGDSITDVDAFRTVRRAGGLAVSFNGNQYAVQEADVAIMSKSALATASVAEVFGRTGRKGVLALAEKWPDDARGRVSKEMNERLSALQEFPEVRRITRHNVKQLAEASSSFRASVRGRAVGSLG